MQADITNRGPERPGGGLGVGATGTFWVESFPFASERPAVSRIRSSANIQMCELSLCGLYVSIPAIFMHSPSESVGEDIIVFGLSSHRIRSFVRPDGPYHDYLMNDLSNLDETYKEISAVPTDDLITF